MTLELHLDFESRSPVSPGDVGLFNYIFHPETEPLFLWYRIGAGKYKCWRIWETHWAITEVWPQDLTKALEDNNVMLVAFNSSFERYMLKKMGWDIPASRFVDPQVGGRYLSLPASLDVQCEVLGVPEYLGKMKRGSQLIKLFCNQVVTKATKRNPTPRSPYYNDWNSHPKEWKEFLEYGRQDVVAEGELLRRMRILGALPLPEFEQKLWLLDQTVNDRGMPTDRVFVEKMYRLALRAKAEAKEKFEALTGVKNANSPVQVKAWAVTQGYPYPSLNKDIVTSALKDPTLQLTDLCREALKLRREAASTSYTKLPTILDCIADDGMLRCQFVFMGSSRCGRWSGSMVQLHNFPRPGKVGGHDFEDQDVVREARALVSGEKYDEIKAKYGSVLLVVKNLLRTVFVAPTI